MRINLLILVFLIISTITLYAQVDLVQLNTEHLKNPVGLGEFHPRFSWVLTSNDRKVIQTAYEVRVGQDEIELIEGKRLSWHCGKVNEAICLYLL
jgi:alpha-L-rhamnosidase